MKNNQQFFIMITGLTCSGKSFISKKISELHKGAKIYSFEQIEKTLNENKDKNLAFELLKEKIVKDLSKGKTVIYDSQNISSDKRKKELKEIIKDLNSLKLKNLNPNNIIKIALYVDVSLNTAIRRNSLRLITEQIPLNKLQREYDLLEYPSFNEGWDKIKIIEND